METEPHTITDEEIRAAGEHGDDLFCTLMDHLDEEDELDPAAVAYTLWIHLTTYLNDSGWTPEQLAQDVQAHLTKLGCQGNA
jgi:hypothetical protein